jgi:hypothetical protein
VKKFWLIMAAAGGLLAVFFALREDFDKAFVAAAAGAVCWFLNYRQQLKATLAREDENNDEETDEEVRS